MTLNSLSPQSVWHYFEEICQVPRPSKHEEQIIAYLMNFGKQHELETKCDETGNVLICKKATKGFENRKTVVLQSHMDMVCEKNSDTVHDFMKDPIVPFVHNEWVKAKGTTLGADDGIGMAVQLAILAANDLQHGDVECLFTVDEETGLSGAFGLKEGFFTGKTLINLDSEEEGEIFIGCAGGMDTSGCFGYEYCDVPEKSFAFRVIVSGLQGGHSGDDIHRGLGNANKLLTRFLYTITRELGFKLSAIDGGNLRNAIAREAWAEGVVPFDKKEDVRVQFNIFVSEIENEYRDIEPNLRVTLESIDTPERILSESLQCRLLNALYAMPHGVIAMSREIKDLTQTSTNLASVKMKDDGIWVATSQRSSTKSEKHDVACMVEAVFRLASAECTGSDGYPGWAPDMNSEILKTAVETYRKLFGTDPKVKAIHAGLECGLFLEKYQGLDMISVGPTLRGVHSPDERLLISSVSRFWQYLLEILVQMPANKRF